MVFWESVEQYYLLNGFPFPKTCNMWEMPNPAPTYVILKMAPIGKKRKRMNGYVPYGRKVKYGRYTEHPRVYDRGYHKRIYAGGEDFFGNPAPPQAKWGDVSTVVAPQAKAPITMFEPEAKVNFQNSRMPVMYKKRRTKRSRKKSNKKSISRKRSRSTYRGRLRNKRSYKRAVMKTGPTALLNYDSSGVNTCTSNQRAFEDFYEFNYANLRSIARTGEVAGTTPATSSAGLFGPPPLTGFSTAGVAVEVQNLVKENETFRWSTKGYIELGNKTSVRVNVTCETWVCMEDSDISLESRLDDLYERQQFFVNDADAATYPSVQDHVRFDGTRVPNISKYWKRIKSVRLNIDPNMSYKYKTDRGTRSIKWDSVIGQDEGGTTFNFLKGHTVVHRVYLMGSLMTENTSKTGYYSFGSLNTIHHYELKGCRIGAAASSSQLQYNLSLGDQLDTTVETDLYAIPNSGISASANAVLIKEIV